MTLKFENHYHELGSHFYTSLDPSPLTNPKSVIFNDDELKRLGFSTLSQKELIAFFSGNQYPSNAKPLAMKYAGHQFGYYNPDLGDGRGLLMAQLRDPSDQRLLDLHLKGAGMTPYSRMGDGRAVLRSSIREFLASEALYHLGIPSTRALGVTTSDEPVRRESVEKASMLMRLGDGHVRFGTFEHFFYTNQLEQLEALCDYTIKHHFPEAAKTDNPYDHLLYNVAAKTAKLIAKWQAFGFAHGVLNTDNMSITGQTFDFGPFGFMENYDPYYICNHSDGQGRYAFNKQPAIGQWNLQALIQALSPLLSDDAKSIALDKYQQSFSSHYHELMSKKLGLPALPFSDKGVYQDLLDLMDGYRIDYTLFFRQLSHYNYNDDLKDISVLKEAKSAFSPWFDLYNDHLKSNADNDAKRHVDMCAINPKYILRNYLAQIAIQASEAGDHEELKKLYTVLKNPFAEQPEYEDYAKESPAWGKNMQISCSS